MVPYVVQNHGGIKIGIIGLTTTSTYTSAHPKITQDFDFWNFETSVRKYYDDVITAGADIVIVLAHEVPSTLISLASAVADLDIDVFLGGHGGGPIVTSVGDSLIAMAGHYATQYVKIILSVDTISKTVVEKEGTLHNNIEGEVTPDSEVQLVVDYWVNLINVDEVISYTSEYIYDYYPESAIGNLVTDGFLYQFDYINFGVTNRGGGFRDDFRTGDITLGDIVSVIPFENNLLEFLITGAQLLEMIEDHHGYYCYSGIRYTYSYNPTFHITAIKVHNIVSDAYEDIILTNMYSGIMSDYSWWVNHKDDFATIDLGVHYRDPVIAYFRTLDDLSLYTLDGRIAESDEGPLVSEFSQITIFILGTFMLSIISISYFVIGKKKK